MDHKVFRFLAFLGLILLVACNRERLPNTTDTPILLPTGNSTPTSTSSPTPTSTATPIPPTATPTPPSTQRYTPVNVMAGAATPAPGWTMYVNDFFGYTINIPADAIIHERGAEGMDMKESIPPGFTFDEYFDYVLAILPKKLCVSFEIPGAHITIAPPYEPFGSFMGPCPGWGIGSQYNMEGAFETLWIAGQQYKNYQGYKLYLQSTGAFDTELYSFNLDNGFSVRWSGGPRGEMSYESYLAQRGRALDIMTTLHWYRPPDLTKPGTTCAGKFTRLTRTVDAIVVRDGGVVAHSNSSADSSPIGQLPFGTIVKIMEGPVCTNERVLWQAASDLIEGGVGWIAEGDGVEYYLEPYRP